MEMQMYMDADFIEGKKIKVNRDGRSFFYTVESVLEINDIFIIFLDRYSKEQYVRILDILEVIG